MEEDAGKSIHDKGAETLVDLNRTGVPLIEIVSEPVMHSAEEAYLYLTKLKQILTYLDICNGNMEEGSLRCDANVSIRLHGETELGTKAEVKNMNSFKNVEKAINVEIARQIEIVEDGEKIIQQTLLWDADLEDVFPMRSKEESHDYRYFPEPDLMPVVVSEEWKNEIAKNLPELPEARKNRFVNDFNLPEYDAEVLTSIRPLADYYEKVISVTKDYKSASNWVMGDVLKIVKEDKIEIADFPISAENIGKLIELINNNTISGKIAKDVFPEMLKTNEDPAIIVKEKNLVQITDTSQLEKIIDEIIANNQAQVQQYLSGKESVIGFFVGQVMKASQGKANPKAVNELLKLKLDEQK
jgi:aspartyl-tRNA(Asn)/glutamyl-tRNA(Gln) amidotransferase subunit B